MNSQRYTPEFYDEAIQQIVERGYSISEVSERLDVSSHSLYKWVKAIKPDKMEQPGGRARFLCRRGKNECVEWRMLLISANRVGNPNNGLPALLASPS